MNKKFKFRNRKNGEIRVPEVRLIDETGKQLGIFPTWKALNIAKEKSFDLVEVAPGVRPPVCRIMDFGKFLYSQQKEERKTKAKKILVKKIQIKSRTGEHDLEFKVRQIEKFIKKGFRVETSIFLRGREKAHLDLAKEKLEEFIARTKDFAAQEEEIKKTPSGFSTILIPKKDA